MRGLRTYIPIYRGRFPPRIRFAAKSYTQRSNNTKLIFSFTRNTALVHSRVHTICHPCHKAAPRACNLHNASFFKYRNPVAEAARGEPVANIDGCLISNYLIKFRVDFRHFHIQKQNIKILFLPIIKQERFRACIVN